MTGPEWRNLRFLHFAPDDKFVPFLQETFEAVFPGKNEYRIARKSDKCPAFVKSSKTVLRVDKAYWGSARLEQDLKSADCLVINFMTKDYAKALKKVPNDMLIVWMGWGDDYYRFIEPYLGDFHLAETKALLRNLLVRKIAKPSGLRQLVQRVFEDPQRMTAQIQKKVGITKNLAGSYMRKAVSRIDVVSILEEEKALFKKAFPEFQGVYRKLQLYSAERIFNEGPDRMQGSDILVGNSATATNNHLELFDLIKHLELEGRRIIAPLNYGDIDYADAVECVGERYFGDRFVALRDYLPLEEYYNYISNCGTVLMNHVRQQAHTTIATSLYKGAKVYLREENLVFPFYRKMGINVWSIQNNVAQSPDVFGPLSEEETAHNRSILNNYWGHDVALDAIRELGELVFKKRLESA